MKKKFFSLEEVTLPFEELMEESLMLVKGGGVRAIPNSGAGCGCGCIGGSGCGCGCGCLTGAGCGCSCG